MTDQLKVDALLAKYQTNDDVYFDLMQLKIREILLVATQYDAFILEQEGQLSEVIFQDYFQLNLSSAPRITSVSTGKSAMELLEEKHFDLVIVMMRIADVTPFQLSDQIRAAYSQLPIILLLKDNSEISVLAKYRDPYGSFDNVFVWNGESKIFVAMVKYIEDKLNAEMDTKIGLVRIILLVEDSIRYYSRYLPILYVQIIKQTQQLISEESPYEQKKLLRMRARPKVLMARTYEEAVALIDKYKDYLLCVISDVKYLKANVMDDFAGFKLIEFIRKQHIDLPSVIQSSDVANKARTRQLNATFINKNSDRLENELVDFFRDNLGFGDFIFRDEHGEPHARARSMEELRSLLTTIPAESLVYHGSRNHFSAWLMARGEIQIAKKIQPIKVTQFEDLEALRDFLVNVFKRVYLETTRGKIVRFDESVISGEGHIIRLSEGSLGGKGRGITFVNHLLQEKIIQQDVNNMPIKIPRTAVIGTQTFENFLDTCRGFDPGCRDKDHEILENCFLNGQLPDDLVQKLKRFLAKVHYPLAVRSSSQFEDSLSQPFSGVYATYLLPNNHPDPNIRLKQLQDAIKMVYASVFSKSAQTYFDAISYKVEEEKMAIVIQEVVGTQFGKKFYPHVSGVAQSYNYYPISYMKPEDSVAMIAVGLGKYVVEGEKTYRFCPQYPKLELMAPKDQFKYSQSRFYALDMRHREYDLSRGEDVTILDLDISEAELDGNLNHIASVWDHQNDRIQMDLHITGPRIINFGFILKYESYPLAAILKHVLTVMEDQLGTPVEIEFAATLTTPSVQKAEFNILQIKHFMRDINETSIDINDLKKEELLLFTNKGMGNGKMEGIQDIIYVDPNTFNRSQMRTMSDELELLNHKMMESNRSYILIGPGRWGTRDPWLGIPIAWAQISKAKVIIETGLEDFVVDASMGSHFFHNITSMNVGYFSVPYKSDDYFIDWEWLKKQGETQRSPHCVHVHLKKPMLILMDGRKGLALIYKSCVA
ncbi:hypothetical protein JW979_03850 [bacterium]|nr:hypothetical protein [candidate division CSSED10-310 bacterium]